MEPAPTEDAVVTFGKWRERWKRPFHVGWRRDFSVTWRTVRPTAAYRATPEWVAG